ncbi:MAG: hypothetical protein C4528_00130 [Gammaproteobacteria bacterium]|nr:MAG: hypothetical protein C4528_00130 [Gammaproteobacteria bacterium]
MKLVTVATYDLMPYAHIAKGRLEAEGIPAVLADEHLVQADWLYSPAVGGIKLQVEAEFAGRARAVLDADYSSSLPDSGDEFEA